MEPRDPEHLANFKQALEGWTDHRFVSADDIMILSMFVMYLVNLGDDAGWVYRGHSWRESEYLGCLVVKAIVDGVPSVVFTNANTTLAGMRIFLRKLEGDFLEWIPDKYA